MADLTGEKYSPYLQYLTGSGTSFSGGGINVLLMSDVDTILGIAVPDGSGTLSYLGGGGSIVTARGRNWLTGHNAASVQNRYWHIAAQPVAEFDPYAQFVTVLHVCDYQDSTDGVNLTWVAGRREGAVLYRDTTTYPFNKGILAGQPVENDVPSELYTGIEFGGNNSSTGPSGQAFAPIENALDDWYGGESISNPDRLAGKICLIAHRYKRGVSASMIAISEEADIYTFGTEAGFGISGEGGWTAYDPVTANAEIVIGGRVHLTTGDIYGVSSSVKIGTVGVFYGTRYLTDDELTTIHGAVLAGIPLLSEPPIPTLDPPVLTASGQLVLNTPQIQVNGNP